MGLLKWAFIFLLVAIVAALFGFGGIAEGAAGIAQVLFFIFLGLFLLFVVLGLFVFRKLT